MSKVAEQILKRELAVKSFLFCEQKERASLHLPAVSLFAGGGLSDLGYELAGFQCIVQAEKEDLRLALCKPNFPQAVRIVGKLRDTWKIVVRQYHERCPNQPLALLSATPPCQGMSNSNPSRGKRSDRREHDARNRLILEAVPVIQALTPRVVVVENVPQFLTEPTGLVKGGRPESILEVFAENLPDYYMFGQVIQMADYGIPQDRRRAIVVAAHEGEEWAERLFAGQVGPWPKPTHSQAGDDHLMPWVTIEDWVTEMGYKPLDARSRVDARDPNDPLHVVPNYEGDYYWRVADIPPSSGLSAYDTSRCRECGCENVPKGTAICPFCRATMHNRPYVAGDNGMARLIKGRNSSYRRMRSDEPARTITTGSSHVGSDYKIHPWENRVLSIRECADLQTVPRFYDWSWALETRHTYLARQVIGEALPPWFTYLEGQLLRQLLCGEEVSQSVFASARWLRGPLRTLPEDHASTQ